MLPRGKTLLLASASLFSALLAILTFAGIINPQPTAGRTTTIELQQRVVGLTGEPHEVKLLLSKPAADLRAALNRDISNRHAVLSSLQLPGNLENVYIDEEKGRAYLANSYSGLQIVDISDLKQLKTLGSLPLPGRAWDIKIMNDILYLAAAEEGLFLIDISSVENPTIISHLKLADYFFLNLELSGNTIYALSGKKGLLIIDVADIRAPRLINTLYHGDGAWGMLTDNKRLYVSCGTYRLETLDISIPGSPRKTGTIPLPDAAWDMAIRDKILYLPTQKSGLLIVDVNRAEQPLRLHHTLGEKRANNIALQLDRGYISSRTGHLSIIDLADPKAPKPLGEYELPFKPRNITVSGGSLFTSTGLTGLQVIDPAALTPVDPARQLKVPGTVQTVLFDEHFFYLATRSHGLHITSRDAGVHPGRIVSSLPVAGFIKNMVRIDNHLYLAVKHSGLQIIDISTPEAPQLVFALNDIGDVEDLVATGKRLILAAHDQGIRVFDVSTPDNPREIGSMPLQQPMKLAVDGNYLYAVTKHTGLHIIAMTNPEAPVQIGMLTLPWPLQDFITAKGLTVHDTAAYLAAGQAGLLVADISKPDAPKLKEILDLNGEVMAVAVDHDKIYATTRQGKLWVLHKHLNKPSSRHAEVDTLGTGLNLTIKDDQAIIANGLQGLTLLPLPQEIEIDKEAFLTLRKRRPAQLTLRIPAQATPGIYNLTLFSAGGKAEFIKALNLQEAYSSDQVEN